jgi:hypothetical protein
MSNQLVSPKISLRKSLPSFNAIITGSIILFLAWAFLSKQTYRFYASILFLFYHFTSSIWISVVLLGVFQTLLMIPFRIINLTKSKHIRDFEKRVNETKQSTEQTFLIKHNARSGNRVFLYYIVDFFVQLTSYVSIGRLFLTDFYSVKISPAMLYDFIPYPDYPLKDTWFKIPYIKVTAITDLGFSNVILAWLIIFLLSTLILIVIRYLRQQKSVNLSAAPEPLKNLIKFFTGSSAILMLVSYLLIRNFPTQLTPAIFTGDVSIPNRTFNTITALATFITILWLDIPTILKKGDLARRAGIATQIISRTQTQLFGESLRSATVVGLGAFYITNLIPCAFELSIFTLEIISWLSPLTLDRLILGGGQRYEAPLTLEINTDGNST